MRVILTHEQADFDALASLLAAYLLDETAFPVLPRRMNRNVRAFLTLYGPELPFIDPQDLSSKEVESALLVDTQGLVTIKGITSKTKVLVVDHHPKRDDLSSDWIVNIDQTGANVTIFVETLKDRNGKLSPVHATLLLLGIYEDTGSLTYSRTTSRDLLAGAFLMDQGASLKVAGDFLNHPLSSEQQTIYDQLRSDAETLKIHGHTIVIASGHAEGLDEELSSLAHKLRDLLEPDALILIITTRSGVQMIARSTSDLIDVGQIMSEFGGGGHDRAAAALIKNMGIEEVSDELKRKLKDFVRPSTTVAEIMSYGLRFLTPDILAGEAAELMQRYGYEGYPIVDQGKVVGLLTRRAVDRAQAHKINLTAVSLMDAGNVSVKPSDSIETLQKVMTESGWGQIPVVNEQESEIIGIVTRTDILKILTNSLENVGFRNLTTRLEAALPDSRLKLLKLVAETASFYHFPIYIVGGFVRDLLLERPSVDFDIVVEGDAVYLAEELAKKYGGRYNTHQQFGTAKWHLYEANSKNQNHVVLKLLEQMNLSDSLVDFPPFLDLITARTEFYTHPTALPEVEQGSIKLDLHRRDFTINTLALRLDGQHYGELHDYWGGLNDLRHKIIRVLHSLSFVDDPTRMLRAVRFEQRFDFNIEDRTLHLLMEAKPLLSRVTGDRLRHELDHILDEPKAVEMLFRLKALDLLKVIQSDLIFDQWFGDKLAGIPSVKPVPEWALGIYSELPNFNWTTFRRGLIYNVWFMRMNEAKIRSICKRIRASKDQTDQIVYAGQVWADLDDLVERSPSQITERLDGISPGVIISCYLAADRIEVKTLLKNYLLHWRNISSSFSGHDLRNQGLQPGPIYKEILTSLRAALLDGEVKNKEEERNLFDALIQQALKVK